MERSAFRFLLQEGDKPFCSSRCYIEADPRIDNRKQWVLHLAAPPKGAEWVYEIDDIKAWMLHGKPVRQIIYDRSNPRTPFRDLDRDAIFREYLRQVFERIPAEYRGRRKYALMPSISNDESRIRYKEAVEAAIPEVTVLPEPEMIAEYFRLLERSLELEPGRNNVILVVDTGASTANMTLILTRRDSTIIDVDVTGAQRDLRLRALRGDSAGNAGHWVDLRLAKLLGADIPDAALLRTIEQAKIEVSLGKIKGSPVVSPTGALLGTVDLATLRSVTGELWTELRPLFESLCERLYKNQTSSENARRKSEERLRILKVNGPRDAHRLIDTILLAGGTSLLPEFEERMLASIFPDGHRPKVLRVGDAFPIAAAAGALAHILHNYSPSRLRERGEAGSEIFVAPLETTLPYPVFLGIKHAQQREQYVKLLDPSDPFVDDGGRRPIEGLPLLAEGAKPKTRLLLGTGAGIGLRRGRPFKSILVKQSPGKMELEWDPTRERATVLSSQVEQTGHLWIEVRKLLGRDEPTLNPYDGVLPPDALAVDGAEDIILDLGMSKIVAVTANRGWISTGELERVVQGEEPIEIVVKADAQPGSAFEARPEIPVAQQEGEEILSVVPGSEQAGDFGTGGVAKAAEAAANVPTIFLPQREEERNTRTGWEVRIPEPEFTQALTDLRDELHARAPQIMFNDIVVALLGLAVRPIVLLAGPPGCGKSTLVRLIAQILGKSRGKNFHDIAVQAHWSDDGVLFGQDGMLRALLADDKMAHLVLLDEFNLTRPEYYLSRLFHALDSSTGAISQDQKLASCRVMGTLNIDESSRVPSPKVIDRCFLLELPQIDWDAEKAQPLSDFHGLTHLLGLPKVSLNGASSDERINSVLQVMHNEVHEHGLRYDLLPSRRVLSDIKSLLSLHNSLDLQARELLDRSELVDRLLASRVLVKLSGAFDQIRPVLDALEKVVEGVEELPRTRRRIKLARQQSQLGFVSPWQ